MIYHIADKKEWMTAKAEGVYSPSSLRNEGFIHCAGEAQIMQIANFYYKGRADLVLLEIDDKDSGVDVKWEKNGPTEFPHVVSPLPTDAVVRVAELETSSDGQFENPFKSVLH